MKRPTCASIVLSTLVVTLGSIAVLATPIGAQEDSAPRTSFVERLEVNVVDVEVFVTDKKGRPVTDLTAEDFEVLEDGKPMELTHFTAPAGLSDPTTAEATGEAEARDPSLSLARRQRAPAHVILFVDNFNIQPHSRRRVLDEVREFLNEASEPDTRFMVASFDGYVNVRQSFTDDHSLVHAALDGLEKLSGPALARRGEYESLLREAQQVLVLIREANMAPDPTSLAGTKDLEDMMKLAEDTFSSLLQQIESTAQRLSLDSRNTVQAMGGFVGALAALPGRKAMVYVSDGVAMRPGEELFWAMDETFQQGRQLRFRRRTGGATGSNNAGGGGNAGGPAGGPRGQNDAIETDFDSSELTNIMSYRTRSQRHSLSRYFEELTLTANTHQVSFYTIDARGGTGNLPDPSIEGRLGAVYSAGYRAVRDANRWETLDVMSSKTGGMTLTGGNVKGLLENMTGDFSSYYSLAYTPTHVGDGKRHAIKVKLKRRGMKTRYRQSYVDKPLAGKVADRTTAALLLELGENPHGVFIETLAASPGDKKGQYSVPMLVKVPLDAVALLPRGEVHACDAKLYIASLSPQGTAGPIQEVTFSIEVPNADLGKIRGQYYTARMDMVLQAGSQRIAIGFWDEAAEVGSFVSHEISVDESAKES